MAYKTQEWTELKRNAIKFMLIVRDQDWKKIEEIRFTAQNFLKTMKEIANRYGIGKSILNQELEIQEEIDSLKEAAIL